MAVITSYEQLGIICARLKKMGWNIMLKTGCFDILHIGHIRMLKKAAQKTDALIVGVGSNETLLTLKGKYNFDEEYRAEVVASLKMVHYVVVLKEKWNGFSDHNELINIIKPTQYHLSGELTQHVLQRKKYCEDMGIDVIVDKPVKIIQNGIEVEPHSSSIFYE